jgi:hypothetical protein
MDNVKLLGKYAVSFSIKAVMIWEAAFSRPFEIRTLTELYMYMYACMLASEEYKGDYDEFIKLVDETPGILEEFNKVMKQHYDNEKAMFNTCENRGTDTKKNGKKKG